jgi:hypothetical protein
VPGGFVDDAESLRGTQVLGVPVLGPLADLASIPHDGVTSWRSATTGFGGHHGTADAGRSASSQPFILEARSRRAPAWAPA